MRPRSHGSGSSSPRCVLAGSGGLPRRPAFRLNLATGDSLLHGPLPSDGASMLFDANRLSQNIAHVFETEDAAELKRSSGRGYHAVVGNPPYIAGDDAALRDAYRAGTRAAMGITRSLCRSWSASSSSPRCRAMNGRSSRRVRRQDHRQQLHEARVRGTSGGEVPAAVDVRRSSTRAAPTSRDTEHQRF